MSTIKSQLGYPDATVMFNGKTWFVAVIDKPLADRVVDKRVPSEGGHVPAEWLGLLAEFRAEWMAEQAAIRSYPRFRADGAEKAKAALTSGKEHAELIAKLWASLAVFDGVSDYDIAMRAMDHHADPDARCVAAMVLANFSERDAVWWAWLDALRDPSDRVSTTASHLLGGSASAGNRIVDWRPASRSIAFVLDGASLGHLITTMNVLVKTEVDPMLAPELLGPGAHAVLDFVGAETGFVHDTARQLLERLTGEYHGRDVVAWRETLAGLRR